MTLLDPKVLAGLGDLSVQAKMIADGVLSGLHRSRRHGMNVEFAEHKDYAPGDDIRYIDWRAYARRDKYSLKRYEEENNLQAFVAVDQSGSMAYVGEYTGGKEIPSKWLYARILAASLAYLLLHQRDAVGLVTLQDGISRLVAPRAQRQHFQDISETLTGVHAARGSRLSSDLEALAAKLTRRSLVFIFSDFFDDETALLAALRALRARKHEVVVFQVVDRFEIDFPFSEMMRFEDLEGPEELLIDAPSVRAAYHEEFQAFLQRVRQGCLAADIDYELAVTDEPPEAVLLRVLLRRR